MSLGPTRAEKVEVSKIARLNYRLKKTAEEYFKEPLRYLLYGTLGLTVIGLFFGMTFAWQFYALLLVFAGIEIYKFFKK